jgi:hypothetical protein
LNIGSRYRLLRLTKAEAAQVRQSSDYQYSTTIFRISLIAVFLILAVLLESVCLCILYVNDSLKGRDTRSFAKEHLLTKLFVSTPPAVDLPPGTHFLGYLISDWDWRQFVVPDDLLGFHLAAASAAIVLDHDKELYITDHNGFIVDVNDPPVTLEKPVNTYRVIVMGGSTVMGQGSPRPSQNIVGILRRTARERGLTGPDGKRVEFINAGVDGYTSAQEYLYFVSDLLRFKPDLVIVYDGWNDSVYGDQRPFRRYSRDAGRLAQSYSISGSAHLFAENLSYFVTIKLGMGELAWRLFCNLSFRLSRGLTHNTHAVHFSPSPLDPSIIDSYRKNRRAFLAPADDQLSVALFLQPLVGTDKRTLSAEEKVSWWYPKLDVLLGNRIPFYEQARHTLEDLKGRDRGNGHHCIADLSHSLKDVSEAVYADSGHLLPKGNEVVAAHMLDELVACGLIRKAA